MISKQVIEILERELQRLNNISETTGLKAEEYALLDKILKVYKFFLDNPSQDLASHSVDSLPSANLIEKLNEQINK